MKYRYTLSLRHVLRLDQENEARAVKEDKSARGVATKQVPRNAPLVHSFRVCFTTDSTTMSASPEPIISHQVEVSHTSY